MRMIKLKYLCKSFSIPLSQQDISKNGKYKVFGASGCVGYMNKYKCDKEYLGIIKDGAGVGRIIKYPKETSLLGTMSYIIPNAHINIGWLKYSIHSLDLGKNNAKTTIPHIYFSEYGNMFIHYCDIDTQQRIADFLDKKCAQIDEILQKTRDTIAEYKKLKQSIITQAVTKGVRGERPMKDSGIEWIGEIPEDYYVCKLKHILKHNMQYGANESGVNYNEELPRYIRITDITIDGKLKNDNKLSLDKTVAASYILKDGDILFARSGATVGKSFIYKSEYGLAAFAGYLIKATVNDNILPNYVYLYTCSNLYEVWKNSIFIQSTIQNIGADKYSEMPIILPSSFIEQQEIVVYLDEKCAEIDTLIEKKEQLLNELESYKKSLIYEYVTGKKEVPV